MSKFARDSFEKIISLIGLCVLKRRERERDGFEGVRKYTDSMTGGESIKCDKNQCMINPTRYHASLLYLVLDFILAALEIIQSLQSPYSRSSCERGKYRRDLIMKSSKFFARNVNLYQNIETISKVGINSTDTYTRTKVPTYIDTLE